MKLSITSEQAAEKAKQALIDSGERVTAEFPYTTTLTTKPKPGSLWQEPWKYGADTSLVQKMRDAYDETQPGLMYAVKFKKDDETQSHLVRLNSNGKFIDKTFEDVPASPGASPSEKVLRDQYAAVGVSASVSLKQVIQVLSDAAARNESISPLVDKYKSRLVMAEKYKQSYRQYCWTVDSLDDIKLAPFHILAAETKTYFDKDHQWHMDTLARLAAASDSLVIATPCNIIHALQLENLRLAYKRSNDSCGTSRCIECMNACSAY